jgi:hypothetical protein
MCEKYFADKNNREKQILIFGNKMATGNNKNLENYKFLK